MDPKRAASAAAIAFGVGISTLMFGVGLPIVELRLG
jgi:hypothetical protein